MPLIARGVVHQAELEDEVSKAAKALDANEIRDLRFTLGTDSSGEPAIFFGILLTPYASDDSRLAEVTGRVSTQLFDTLQPYNRWGLLPYFNFTDDQKLYRDADWM